jgi:hypothetical protein
MSSHCSLNHTTIAVFQLYVSRLPVPPFFGGATSKGRGSFALAMSLSTQAKLWMNFEVSLLMKYNPLYINNSNVINDSSTTTQIQKHRLSRLLVVCVLNDSKMSHLLSRLFQFFFYCKFLLSIKRDSFCNSATYLPIDFYFLFTFIVFGVSAKALPPGH